MSSWNCELSDCVGWAKARKRRAHHLTANATPDGGHAALSPPYDLYDLTIRRQCSHAAWIKFSLASGVRKAECADRVTLESFVNG